MPHPAEAVARLLPLSAGQLGPGLRLFCVPPAGGSAAMFRSWLNSPHPDFEIHPVELPGHGVRINEPAAGDLKQVAAGLAGELEPLLGPRFAFFGHSFGAMVSFEAVAHLAQRGLKAIHLFVSACRSPHTRTTSPLHSLDDDRLLERLRNFGGIPQALLQERELLAYFLPLIRADLRRLETYRSAPNQPLIPCPVTALTGLDDRQATADVMQSWHSVTSEHFEHRLFPGNHFFIQEQRTNVLRLIRERLAET